MLPQAAHALSINQRMALYGQSMAMNYKGLYGIFYKTSMEAVKSNISKYKRFILCHKCVVCSWWGYYTDLYFF